MKTLITLLLIAVCLQINAQEINFLTYNIRFNTPNDGINAWPNRAEMVGGLLRFHDIEIVGLQEALAGQIVDIERQMPQMKHIGVGRDDGKEAGEFSPILYDTTRFSVIKSGWFWLSETPEKPGFGWDAHYNRICTWAIFSDRNKNRFLVLNTHFDHQGDVARQESAKLILRKTEEINVEKLPVILMGDFNLTPGSAPIKYIKEHLSDSREMTIEAAYGPEGTFNGFDFNSKLPDRIDYIFINDKVQILKYATLSDSKDNRYPSDHLPVFTKIRLK